MRKVICSVEVIPHIGKIDRHVAFSTPPMVGSQKGTQRSVTFCTQMNGHNRTAMLLEQRDEAELCINFQIPEQSTRLHLQSGCHASRLAVSRSVFFIPRTALTTRNRYVKQANFDTNRKKRVQERGRAASVCYAMLVVTRGKHPPKILPKIIVYATGAVQYFKQNLLSQPSHNSPKTKSAPQMSTLEASLHRALPLQMIKQRTV